MKIRAFFCTLVNIKDYCSRGPLKQSDYLKKLIVIVHFRISLFIPEVNFSAPQRRIFFEIKKVSQIMLHRLDFRNIEGKTKKVERKETEEVHQPLTIIHQK